MLLWIQDDTECKVPPFSTHHVGVGAAVITDDGKLLVVRERDRKQGGIHGWKLPGGYVNMQEEISSAAEREVLEETGVKSSFEDVLAFRHQLKVQFGRGDVYVICRLKALTTTIRVDSEIDDAKWMPISEFIQDNKYAMLQPIARFLLDQFKRSSTAPATGGLVETTMPSTLPGRSPYKFYMPASMAQL